MTDYTCKDGGRCGIGGYCADCWNVPKHTDKDLQVEKLALLEDFFNRIEAKDAEEDIDINEVARIYLQLLQELTEGEG